MGRFTTGARHGDPATPRHVQIADDDVGPGGLDHLDRLPGLPRLTHDLEAVGQIGAHTVAPDRVVVGQHDPNRRSFPHGTHMLTSVPSPGALRTSTRPPTSATRPRTDR